MFNLIRRISYGVIPRTDRPWEEDPTSNAPKLGRKRRLSSTERDLHDDEDQANKKKARGESATPSVVELEAGTSSPALGPQADATPEVKEVTQGVEEVALDGEATEEVSPDEKTAPEAIPLPEEESGELDELASDPVAEPVEVEKTATTEDTEAASSSAVEETATSEPVPDADEVSSLQPSSSVLNEDVEAPSSIPATKGSPTKAAAAKD